MIEGFILAVIAIYFLWLLKVSHSKDYHCVHCGWTGSGQKVKHFHFKSGTMLSCPACGSDIVKTS